MAAVRTSNTRFSFAYVKEDSTAGPGKSIAMQEVSLLFEDADK